MKELKAIIANPRGWCAGVSRAVEIVSKSMEVFPDKEIWVYHEIVHNKYVIEDFISKGVRFTENVHEVTEGAVFILNAHGVSSELENVARGRNITVIDAVCPLVTKVHLEAQKYEREGRDVILIGHEGHQEVIGTMGRVKDSNKIHLIGSASEVEDLEVSDPENVGVVTQTTLSVDDTKNIMEALVAKYPQISMPKKEDICYATQNRQSAVKSIAKNVDMFLVVGSKNSSNSNRLRELAENCGVFAYLIDGKGDVDYNWFDGVKTIGVTAGASAPELLIEEILADLENKFALSVEYYTEIEENVHFKIPSILANA